MRDFEAITLSKKVGCGMIYCIFNEEEHSFYNLEIKGDMAKEAPCGESWFNSVAAILTYALRRSVWEGTTKKAIIKHLVGHQCNGFVANKEHIKSCSDAIGKMVLEYIKSRGIDEIETETKLAVV
jgi:hypothetical protein